MSATTPSAAPPARRHRRLARLLRLYAFLDEFVLIYPLYAVLFTRTGLSAAQISSLFVVWSLSALLLEVPAGAWADTVSRRLLLVAGPLLGAAGFGLWVAAPGYPAFAAGFVLWGAKSALVSGALEALVYDELDRGGGAADFTRVWGVAQACGVAAVFAATLLASPVLAAGGYRALGVASVAAGVATAAVGLAFPEHRRAAHPGTDPDGEQEAPGYLATVRAGLAAVRTDRRLRRAVLLVPAVTAIASALEEYTPLLASAGGAADGEVPWWEAVVWGATGVGSVVAARTGTLSARALAVLLGVAGLLLAAGGATGRASGIVLVAGAFGVLQVAGVQAQARLQAAVSTSARATVTSVASVGSEVAEIAVYLAYGSIAGTAGTGAAFTALAVPYLVLAVRAACVAPPSGGAGGRRARRATERVTR